MDLGAVRRPDGQVVSGSAPRKAIPKKLTASEAEARREARLLAESKPKPLPRRRRLTKEIREDMRSLYFRYTTGDSPFLPDDWLFGGDLIHDAHSIWVEILASEEGRIGGLAIHTLPLGADWDLFEMADATTTVPHWAVGGAIDFCWPREWVVDKWEVESAPMGTSVMIVENIEVEPVWQGLGLESVFTAVAIHRVGQMVQRCAFALATPVYWWQRADEERYGKVVYERCFKDLGFSRLRRGSRTWILPDFRIFDQEADRLKKRLQLPEHLFAPAWSDQYLT